MNKTLQAIAFSAGGLTLFGGAFIVFSALSGEPLHEIAFLRHFVGVPASPTAPEAERATPEEDAIGARTGSEVLGEHAGLLGAFVLPSPFTSTQLNDVQTELKAKLREVQTELARERERELELDELEQATRDRYDELKAIRSGLEDWERDLELREQELERSASARAEQERESWRTLSKLFAEGDADEAAERLILYTPEEAANILRALDVDRAGEIINSIRGEGWKAYSDAFSRREQ